MQESFSLQCPPKRNLLRDVSPVINLIIALAVLLAIVVVLFKNRDKIKWFKLPERKTTYAQRKGLKEISRKEL